MIISPIWMFKGPKSVFLYFRGPNKINNPLVKQLLTLCINLHAKKCDQEPLAKQTKAQYLDLSARISWTTGSRCWRRTVWTFLFPAPPPIQFPAIRVNWLVSGAVLHRYWSTVCPPSASSSIVNWNHRLNIKCFNSLWLDASLKTLILSNKHYFRLYDWTFCNINTLKGNISPVFLIMGTSLHSTIFNI